MQKNSKLCDNHEMLLTSEFKSHSVTHERSFSWRCGAQSLPEHWKIYHEICLLCTRNKKMWLSWQGISHFAYSSLSTALAN